MIKDTFHVIEYLRLEISTGGSGGNHRSQKQIQNKRKIMARILGIARPGIDREREISEADRKGIMRKICVLVFTIFFMSLEREVYK